MMKEVRWRVVMAGEAITATTKMIAPRSKKWMQTQAAE